LNVLRDAASIVRAVDAYSQHDRVAASDMLSTLEAGVREVQPIAATADECDDDVDDAI
jgi:hypothetical protein